MGFRSLWNGLFEKINEVIPQFLLLTASGFAGAGIKVIYDMISVYGLSLQIIYASIQIVVICFIIFIILVVVIPKLFLKSKRKTEETSGKVNFSWPTARINIINSVLDNLTDIKICLIGLDILYDLATHTTTTKEDLQTNYRLTLFPPLFANAAIFLRAAFDDAIEGKYPSSVINLRAAFEVHLTALKLYLCSDDELNVWTDFRFPEDKSKYRKYKSIFAPGNIMESLPEEIKRKYRSSYGRLSAYAHSSVRGLLDNFAFIRKEDGFAALSFHPYYQKPLTERQLKDLISLLWLNIETIRYTFGSRIPAELSKKIDDYGNVLENYGTFG